MPDQDEQRCFLIHSRFLPHLCESICKFLRHHVVHVRSLSAADHPALQINVPRSVICGLALRVVSISFAFGSLLTNRTVGPMNRGAMLRYTLSFRNDRIT